MMPKFAIQKLCFIFCAKKRNLILLDIGIGLPSDLEDKKKYHSEVLFFYTLEKILQT